MNGSVKKIGPLKIVHDRFRGKNANSKPAFLGISISALYFEFKTVGIEHAEKKWIKWKQCEGVTLLWNLLESQ